MPEQDDTDEPEGDNASDERLLFGERREATTLFVGSSLGVTRVDVAAAQVGQFSLVERCTVTDLATDGEVLLVGTDDAVYLSRGGEFRSLGFGGATAVGVDGSYLYAADEECVARLDRERVDADDDEWETVGTVSESRSFDGNLLATAGGLVRVGSETENLGLANVRASTSTLAATADGVFRRGSSGWERVLAGDATAVISGDGESAYAIVDGTVYEETDGSWEPITVPGDAVPTALADGQTLVVLTEDGTVHVAADPSETHDGHGGWRSQALGLRETTGFVALSSDATQ